MKVLSCVNHKGGVAKTATAVNLASYLALKGHKTILIDLDPQGTATTIVGLDKWHLDHTMYDVMIEDMTIQDISKPTSITGLDIAPSNPKLSKAELELANKFAREYVLQKKVRGLVGYDYVIIDTPPSLGFLTLNALVASNTAIIVIQTEYSALEGIKLILDLLDAIDGQNGSHIEKRFLLTMFESRAKKVHGEIVASVRDTFGDTVFKTIIPRNIKFAECPKMGQPICILAPESTGARAYEELANEVMV